MSLFSKQKLYATQNFELESPLAVIYHLCLVTSSQLIIIYKQIFILSKERIQVFSGTKFKNINRSNKSIVLRVLQRAGGMGRRSLES